MDDIYAYVFKGFLTNENLKRQNYNNRFIQDGYIESKLVSKLSIPELDDNYVNKAKKMSIVYIAITAFENSVRDFVQKILAEVYGDD